MKPSRFILGIALLLAAFVAVFWIWTYRIEHRYDSLILAASRRYGVEPGTLKSLIWRESRFDATARGKAGEIGLMQIGEDAAREWADAERVFGFDHEQCVSPVTNTLAGTWYLRKALSKYPAVDDPLPYALAEYNAGRGNVLRWKTGEASTNSEAFMQQIGFPSTSNYVRDILAHKAGFQNEFQSK